MPARRVRLGMMTPSSNTVLEPVTAQLLAPMPEVSAHFARFRVTQIGLSRDALEQFDPAPMVAAAALLADAHVDVIAWNGTSAAWLGFEADERLCAAITAETGIPATSAVLAYRELFRLHGLARIGLVTPYTADVQARIAATWSAAGFACAAERHLGIFENFAFGLVAEEEIARMCRAVAAEGVDAIAILCTNLSGAFVAAALEQEFGIPVLDSVSVTLWRSLALAGVDPAPLGQFGRIFARPH